MSGIKEFILILVIAAVLSIFINFSETFFGSGFSNIIFSVLIAGIIVELWIVRKNK